MSAPVVSLTNRRIVLLAVLSLIASLFAATAYAPPASADTEEVSFDSAGPSNVAEEVGFVNLDITVSSTNTFLGPVTFDISTGGSATLDDDYSLSDSDFTFNAAGTQTLTVTIANNSVYEGDEDIVLGLTSILPGTASGGTNTSHTINISDAADLPTIDINTPGAVTEGSAITYTVTRTGATEVDIEFDATTSTDSATKGTDFTDDFSSPITLSSAGSTATFSVDTIADSNYEGAGQESFNVSIDSPVGATLGTTTDSVGLINDGDPVPTININSPPAVTEGSTITFTVTRSIGSEFPITFDASTSDGTAGGSDYTDAFSNPITIPAGGGGTATFDVDTDTDSTYEGGQESFNVLIDNIGNANGGTTVSAGLINDADSAPTLTLSSPSESEGTDLTFVASIDAVSDIDVTARADTSLNSAEAGDFTAVTNQLVTIAAGDTSENIVVSVLSDVFFETDETFTLSLTSVTDASGTPSATGTIENDDAAPAVTVDSPSTAENAGPTTFTVTRTGFTEVDVTGSASTADGTATAVDDYNAVTGQAITITADANEVASTAVNVTHKTDLVDETLNETFDLNVTSITAAATTSASGTAIILDDDGEPALSISDETVTEGGTATFTVTRVGETALPISVTATTSVGTASFPGDYDSKSGTVNIGVGDSSATFTVNTNPDSIDEDDETFNVVLSNPTNAVIADGTGVGTIEDNDAAPTLSINNVTKAEAGGSLTFTITRTGLTERTVSVTATTADGTASAGSDYTANSESVVIPSSGSTNSATFSVPITNDSLVESAETLDVNLTTPLNATIDDSTGVGTITDNDTAGVTIVESDDDTSVLEGVGNDSYTVALSAQPKSNVVVTITPDSQVTTVPTSITFTNGNWSTPRTVTVTANEDGIDEPDPHDGIIQHSTSSSHGAFNGLAIPNLTVNVGDADALLASIVGPTKGAPGEAATFTATVNAGGSGEINYQWLVYLNGNLTGITGPDQNTLTFTPSDAGIYSIQALITDDNNQTPTNFIIFTALGDIEGNIFVDDIIWLAEEGITRGCNPAEGNTNFCPNDFVTRGQMAAFLSRFLGLTDSGVGDLFEDDDNSIFETNIDQLATAGITLGCNPADGNTNFCPEDRVTRGQMAAFLVRALGLTDRGAGDLFDDDNGSVFEKSIDILATAEITKGCNPGQGNTNFCPNDFVTRGQMAAFLRRADKILNP